MSFSIEKLKKVKKSLLKEFNWKSKKSIVVGAGISSDNDGEYIKVLLEKAPTAKQMKNFPQTKDGVRVKYEVTGKISAFKG